MTVHGIDFLTAAAAMKPPTPDEVAKYGRTASGHCAVHEVVLVVRRLELTGAGDEVKAEKPLPAYMNTADAFGSFGITTPEGTRAAVGKAFLAGMFVRFDRGDRVGAIDVGHAFILSGYAFDEARERRTGLRRLQAGRLRVGNFHWSAAEFAHLARQNVVVVDRKRQDDIFAARDENVRQWVKAGSPSLAEYTAATAI